MLVHYEVSAGVGTITLDSPPNRNALSTQMMRTMLSQLATARSDKAVRVLVLSHTGRVFCSGMDLAQAAGDEQPVTVFPPLLQAIWDFPKPTVARVGGPARAGGIGLFAACDIVVAAADATFAFTEVRLGVVPAVIAATVLPRLPAPAARELFLTGEVFDGRRAAALGLVNSAVKDVDAEVARYVELLLRGGPTALAATKDVLRQRPGVADFPELVALSERFFGATEGQEGIAAFREKRPPNWIVR
jgi:methylglutaconyl-CoA hydratase